jgi:hypothetical protein
VTPAKCGTEEAGKMPAVRERQAGPGYDAREVRYGRGRQDARGAGEAGKMPAVQNAVGRPGL